jgi:hypothetical protein
VEILDIEEQYLKKGNLSILIANSKEIFSSTAYYNSKKVMEKQQKCVKTS